MYKAIVGHRRSYGNVVASGGARVVAGDYNIHMERPTFNVSCPCLCDSIASGHHVVHANQRTPRISSREPTDTVYDDGYNKTYANHLDRARAANHLPDVAEQDYRTDETYEDTDTVHLHATPARLITSSTERRKPIDKNNLMTESDIAVKPVDSAKQLLSEHFTTQGKMARSILKGVRSNAADSRSIGKDYHHRTCVAPSQTPSGLQASVTFRDDLTKPCIFAREDSLHRLFLLRRETLDWTQSVCTESLMPASQIKERIDHGPNKYRRKKQNIQRILGKLEPQRRRVLECLLEKVNHCDPHGYRWFIVAVDVENYVFTRRTGEVDTFSVVLAKTLDDPK